MQSTNQYRNTTPSKFCVYYTNRDEFQCINGVDVIIQNYGTMSLFKFIARSHLTEKWKSQYKDVDHDIP